MVQYLLRSINSAPFDYISLFMLVNTGLLVILLYINRKYLKSFLSKIPFHTWVLLSIIFISAFLVRLFIPPLEHYLYIDEPLYIEAGKNILQFGAPGNYVKSIGWPFILAIVFAFFGVSSKVAIYTSLIFGALTVFPMFFLSLAMTKRQDISLIATLLLTLFPAHIRWSTTAETPIVSLFFITLVLFFCFLFYRYKKLSLLWLAVVGLALVAQFRPENYILPGLFILGWLFYKNKISGVFNRHFIFPVFTFFALSFTNLLKVLNSNLFVNWLELNPMDNLAGSNWSLNNFIYNNTHIAGYLVNNVLQPMILIFLIIIGSVYLIRKNRSLAYFLLSWLAIFYLIYFSSWPSLLRTYFKASRLFIYFYPVYSILTAFGILFISQTIIWLSKKIQIKISLPKTLRLIKISGIFYLLSITIVLLFIPYIKGTANLGTSDYSRLETIVPGMAKQEIPVGCTIIAIEPPVLKATTDFEVIAADQFLEDKKIQNKTLSAPCVLFFEDMYCFEKLYQKEISLCKKVRNDFIVSPLITYNLSRARYTFYTLLSKDIDQLHSNNNSEK